jgi:L-fucose isomerase-like protein
MFSPTVKIGFIPSVRHGNSNPIKHAPPGPIPTWCVTMRADTLQSLGKIKGVEVVVPSVCPTDRLVVDSENGYSPDGVIFNLDQAEAITSYFQRQGVDGLIIGALNFGDERSAALIAERMHLPILLFATKEPPVPPGPSKARVSDSYCGTLSISSALYRRRIPFHYAGIFLPDEGSFQTEIETFVRAVAVVKNLRAARLGQVGVRPDTFETVAYDETALIRKFGQSVIHLELSELVAAAQSLADDHPQVMLLMDAMRNEVSQVTVADTWLRKAAKLEIAASAFFTRNRLSAMGMQCWPAIQSMWGFSTCALFGRLTGRGMLTACEVDILGSLSMLINYSAALGETIPHFIDWTIQHREDDNRFLAWHCGNAPVCLADNPAKTALRSREDMEGALPANPEDSQAGLYQFQVKPGIVTICRLAEFNEEWKLLISSGEIVPSDESLAGTWSWVKVRDHAHLYRTLVEEGFIHHASMIHGDQVATLKMACKFLNIKAVVVE